MLLNVVSWRLASWGLGKGDNTEDHLPPKASTSQASVGNPLLSVALGIAIALCLGKAEL